MINENAHVQIINVHKLDQHYSDRDELIGLKGHVEDITKWSDSLKQDLTIKGFYSCLFLPDNPDFLDPIDSLYFYAVKIKEI
jgi:hypothetical protein